MSQIIYDIKINSKAINTQKFIELLKRSLS